MSFPSPDIDEKLEILHKEMACLRVECDRLLNKHLIGENSKSQNCSNGAADTSSAYNTGGESCRSVSVTPDALHFHSNRFESINHPPQSPRVLRRTNKLESPAVRRRFLSPPAIRPPTVVLPHDDQYSQSAAIHRTQPEHKRKNLGVLSIEQRHSVTPIPRSIIDGSSVRMGGLKGTSFRKLSISKNLPSTSQINEEEVKKQDSAAEYAKRFRIPSYSIVLKEEKKRNSFRIPLPSYLRFSKTKSRDFSGCEEEIEEVVDEEKMAAKTDIADMTIHYKWKVKRRCDGSRYVVKRPIRSQILKKREAQLYRERAPISTDDDAMSELKLGRFHTKEERKRILEREKMKKLKKLQLKMAEKSHPAESVSGENCKSKHFIPVIFDDSPNVAAKNGEK